MDWTTPLSARSHGRSSVAGSTRPARVGRRQRGPGARLIALALCVLWRANAPATAGPARRAGWISTRRDLRDEVTILKRELTACVRRDMLSRRSVGAGREGVWRNRGRCPWRRGVPCARGGRVRDRGAWRRRRC